MKKEKVVIVSGYFDPLHIGHLEYFKMAKELGDTLVVIVNNEKQCRLKKGDEFMFKKFVNQFLINLKNVESVV